MTRAAKRVAAGAVAGKRGTVHAKHGRADAKRATADARRGGMRAKSAGAAGADADTVFRALGDPTRRALLDHLRVGERVVTELCAPFAMSQPAISQHLKVLADAGLVVATRRGRERVYQLCAAPLRAAFDWLAHYETFWTQGLDRLGAFLDAEDAAAAATVPPGRPRAARGAT